MLTADEIRFCDEVAMRAMAALIVAMGREAGAGMYPKAGAPRAHSWPDGEIARHAYLHGYEMLRERRMLLARKSDDAP